MTELLFSLGKVVSGYVIHNGKWKEIGRKNPQLPQVRK